MFKLNIKGAKKLQRKMAKLERKVQNRVMLKAMKDAMQPVVPAAQARAPVERGRLRKYIKVTTKNSRKVGLLAMVQTGTRKQLGIPADNKYYYPSAIEYGTRHISARSFLRRALGSKRNQVLDDFGRNIRRELSRV